MPYTLWTTPPNVVYRDESYFVFEIDADYHLFDETIAGQQFIIYNVPHQHEIAFLVLQNDRRYWIDVLTDESPKFLATSLEHAVAVAAREFELYLSGET